jgi:DNA-binding PadR family transcriptional regulator
MRNELTELEQCVLGVIWRDGPMTAYEIAALFAKSLSPYWSGSAGAIYPVVARLRKRGLAGGKRQSWNDSQKTVLKATKKGVTALRKWLTPPLPAGAGAPTHDSLRTRVYFTRVLPPAQQRRFLDDAERVVAAQLASVRRQYEKEIEDGNESEAIGQLGVIFEGQARLRWLRAVRKRLSRS